MPARQRPGRRPPSQSPFGLSGGRALGLRNEEPGDGESEDVCMIELRLGGIFRSHVMTAHRKTFKDVNVGAGHPGVVIDLRLIAVFLIEHRIDINDSPAGLVDAVRELFDQRTKLTGLETTWLGGCGAQSRTA
jgi:hypothetical protein